VVAPVVVSAYRLFIHRSFPNTTADALCLSLALRPPRDIYSHATLLPTAMKRLGVLVESICSARLLDGEHNGGGFASTAATLLQLNR
jgi:hypothetical protein